MKTKKLVSGLAMAVALMFVGATAASAASVEPTLVDPWQSGDAAFECGQVTCCASDYHYKFDNWDVTYNGPYSVDGRQGMPLPTITILKNDGTSFDWTSDWPVSCLIVKGSNAANVYCYDSPVYGDTGMFAPTRYDKDGMAVGTYEISHATYCYNEPEETGMCWGEETAWAKGTRYVNRGNWAMYVAYPGNGGVVELIAGQTIPVGSATFSNLETGYVTITINLTDAIFYYDVMDPLYDNNLKVQDYALKPPAKNPAPGKFTWKKLIGVGETTGSITVPLNKYYGIHLDVAVPVPCE